MNSCIPCGWLLQPMYIPEVSGIRVVGIHRMYATQANSHTGAWAWPKAITRRAVQRRRRHDALQVLRHRPESVRKLSAAEPCMPPSGLAANAASRRRSMPRILHAAWTG